MQAHIEVKSISAIHTIGKSYIGIDTSSTIFKEVIRWAKIKGLLRHQNFKMATIYYDSFKTTAPDKIRMYSCLIVEKPYSIEGDLTSVTIKKGNYIIAHHEITTNEFKDAWTTLFMWMNSNGYRMRNEPPFVVYHNDSNTHPQKICIVDLYIPV